MKKAVLRAGRPVGAMCGKMQIIEAARRAELHKDLEERRFFRIDSLCALRVLTPDGRRWRRVVKKGKCKSPQRGS